jgi:hypothetical protein
MKAVPFSLPREGGARSGRHIKGRAGRHTDGVLFWGTNRFHPCQSSTISIGYPENANPSAGIIRPVRRCLIISIGIQQSSPNPFISSAKITSN